MRKIVLVLVAVALMGMVPIRTASAADLHLTFSGPVALSGVVLPAGTYVFRMLAPKVVQVISKDRTTVYAMRATMSTNRTEASEKAEVTFNEGRSDAPPEIHAWFAPWEVAGEMFYEKAPTKSVAH